jgi:hypothetical protein
MDSIGKSNAPFAQLVLQLRVARTKFKLSDAKSQFSKGYCWQTTFLFVQKKPAFDACVGRYPHKLREYVRIEKKRAAY